MAQTRDRHLRHHRAMQSQMVSASANYRSGELDVSAATERHNQYANTTTATTKDTAEDRHPVQVCPHGISVVTESIKFQGNVGATARPRPSPSGGHGGRQKATFVGYPAISVYTTARHHAKTRTWNSTTAHRTQHQRRMVALGYGYDFSKRTEGDFHTKITNASASRHDFAVNGLIAANNNGADVSGLAIGIGHRFRRRGRLGEANTRGRGVWGKKAPGASPGVCASDGTTRYGNRCARAGLCRRDVGAGNVARRLMS